MIGGLHERFFEQESWSERRVKEGGHRGQREEGQKIEVECLIEVWEWMSLMDG